MFGGGQEGGGGSWIFLLVDRVLLSLEFSANEPELTTTEISHLN